VIDKVKNRRCQRLQCRTDTYEDLIKAGVIDPTKVTRFRLAECRQRGSLMLTTEAMIAEKPEEKRSDA
jgi:chaperonin GroEL